MKTQLPQAITTIEEAKHFLSELFKNEEVFHPEDDAHDIIWEDATEPTFEEKELLNKLMEDIYDLGDFDPCEFILDSLEKANS